MFEDHWYHTSSAQEEEARARTPLPGVGKRLKQDEIRSRSSTPAPETTRAQATRTHDDPPTAEVVRNVKSIENLKSIYPEEEEIGENTLEVKDPKRTLRKQKSLYEFRKPPGAETRKAQDIFDVLDYAQWVEAESLQKSLTNSKLEEYRTYKNILQSYVGACDGLIQESDASLKLLDNLKVSFSQVHAQTSVFQTQCDNLVGEEMRLRKLHEEIARGLWPYGQLEMIMRKLHKPGTEFVRTRGFVEMLDTLDQCLDFCNKHPDFLDTDTYRARFRQCLTRALTLIRVYFVNTIKEVVAEIDKKLAGKAVSESAKTSLLYAKFRVVASELRQLTGEIDRRCNHEEYKSLLAECYSPYVSIRQRLLSPIVQKRVTEIAAGNSDVVILARSGISYLRSVCTDEWDLWHSFFEGGDEECIAFLQTIFNPLQNVLRPRINQTLDLRKLCELCTLLQSYAQKEQDEHESYSYERPRFDFSRLLENTLLETQRCIGERVKAIIRHDVQGFRPTPADLDYPSILIRNRPQTPKSPMQTSNTPVPLMPKVIDKDDISMMEGNESGFGAGKEFAAWYPTLRKGVWLLSRIYKLVNPTVYGSLAHQIVHACTVSLLEASERISRESSIPDGQLFLIKHLLILKEQIIAFDIEYIPVQPQEITDNSLSGSLTGTLWNLYEKGSMQVFRRENLVKFLPGSLAPLVDNVENMVDAKVELDARLRTVITDFTAHYTLEMTSPIQNTPSALASQPQDPTRTIQGLVSQTVPLLRQKLSEYLPDVRTRETLVGAVQEKVIDAYAEFEGRVRRGENRGVVAERVWGVETFAEWSVEAFGVQMLVESPRAASPESDAGSV